MHKTADTLGYIVFDIFENSKNIKTVIFVQFSNALSDNPINP